MANPLPPPALPPFSMTDDELQSALDMPIEKPIRAEAKILPDVDKPNSIRRVVATGIVAWSDRGDRSLSRLILHLLYLYFTGQIQVTSSSYVSRFNEASTGFDASDDDEDFEIDFGFKEG